MILELVGVEVALGGRVVLRGVTLAVAEGQKLLVVGPSGSGKSTLLRVVAGLQRPAAGRVQVAGASPTPGASHTQLLFQDPLATLHPELPVGTSLLETAWLHPGPGSPARRAAEALAAVGLSDVGFRLPGSLSGGERRRASVARVSMARPRLLLADEPTTGLDQELQASIARLVLAAAPTVIVVTHDPEPFLPWVDRVVTLRAGALSEAA